MGPGRAGAMSHTRRLFLTASDRGGGIAAAGDSTSGSLCGERGKKSCRTFPQRMRKPSWSCELFSPGGDAMHMAEERGTPRTPPLVRSAGENRGMDGSIVIKLSIFCWCTREE